MHSQQPTSYVQVSKVANDAVEVPFQMKPESSREGCVDVTERGGAKLIPE